MHFLFMVAIIVRKIYLSIASLQQIWTAEWMSTLSLYQGDLTKQVGDW